MRSALRAHCPFNNHSNEYRNYRAVGHGVTSDLSHKRPQIVHEQGSTDHHWQYCAASGGTTIHAVVGRLLGVGKPSPPLGGLDAEVMPHHPFQAGAGRHTLFNGWFAEAYLHASMGNDHSPYLRAAVGTDAQAIETCGKHGHVHPCGGLPFYTLAQYRLPKRIDKLEQVIR